MWLTLLKLTTPGGEAGKFYYDFKVDILGSINKDVYHPIFVPQALGDTAVRARTNKTFCFSILFSFDFRQKAWPTFIICYGEFPSRLRLPVRHLTDGNPKGGWFYVLNLPRKRTYWLALIWEEVGQDVPNYLILRSQSGLWSILLTIDH